VAPTLRRKELVSGYGTAKPGGRNGRDGLGVTEMGGGAVPELVEVESGVLGEQHAGAVVAEPGPARVRADVFSVGAAGRDRATLGQEQRATCAGGAVRQAQQPGQESALLGFPEAV
jgi:hypothetical protein